MQSGVQNEAWKGKVPKKHADRWREVGELVEKEKGMVQAFWTKSHVEARHAESLATSAPMPCQREGQQ